MEFSEISTKKTTSLKTVSPVGRREGGNNSQLNESHQHVLFLFFWENKSNTVNASWKAGQTGQLPFLDYCLWSLHSLYQPQLPQDSFLAFLFKELFSLHVVFHFEGLDKEKTVSKTNLLAGAWNSSSIAEWQWKPTQLVALPSCRLLPMGNFKPRILCTPWKITYFRHASGAFSISLELQAPHIYHFLHSPMLLILCSCDLWQGGSSLYSDRALLKLVCMIRNRKPPQIRCSVSMVPP